MVLSRWLVALALAASLASCAGCADPQAETWDAGDFDAEVAADDAGSSPDAGAAKIDAGKPGDAGHDAGSPDAGPHDAGSPDTGPHDAGSPDAGSTDAGHPDSGSPDAGTPAPDAATPGPDAGSDAGAADSGVPFDAGAPGPGGCVDPHAGPFGTQLCGRNHWTWVEPQPQGQTLYAVWGASANDVWAAGVGGTILHYNGTSWSAEESGTCETLSGLWGTSATNLYAVGTLGTVLHRTAAGWSKLAAPTCNSLRLLWGSSVADVWIGGDKLFLYWDGQNLSAAPLTVANTYVEALSGLGSSDVWAIASGGLLHYDGRNWSTVATISQDLSSVLVADPSHVFAAGYSFAKSSSLVLTFPENDAAHPTEHDFYTSSSPALGGSSASDVWATNAQGAHHWNGSAWTYWPATTGYGELRDIWSAGPSEAWGAGTNGLLTHWNGAAWAEVTPPMHSNLGLWASSATDAWLATGKGMRHWDGTIWSGYSSGFFDAVWGTSSTDVWAVGLGALIHYDGTAWSTGNPAGLAHYYSVRGSGPNDVWTVGYQGKTAHWDGTAWTVKPSASSSTYANANDVWVGSPSNVWVASDDGMYRWNGSGWDRFLSTYGAFYKVWGSGGEVWAGGPGHLMHFDATTWWTEVIIDSYVFYRPLWGTGPNDVWVGRSGEFGAPNDIVHWDGLGWTRYRDVASSPIVAIHGIGSTVYAAGQGGELLKLGP